MISDILAMAGWVGLVAFAVSGALVASRKQMDIIAFVFFGTVTALAAARCAISCSACPCSG